MNAIAGLWTKGGGAAGARPCGAMLDALAIYGRDHRDEAHLGPLSIGRNLSRLVPEDAYDQGVLVGGAGSLLLGADIRIDNRPELAAAIGIPPAEARTWSDSALLLAGIERWGEGVLDRIVGDFAFAWYDDRARRLILARDPLGQRPLFWHQSKDFFAFASMPNGLYALPEIGGAADLVMAARFAALLPQLGETSYHQHIRRIEPGHLLVVTENGAASRRYWTPERQELRLKSFGDYVEAYRAKLDEAVSSRLRGAGALVASHLSGGWDSSAVTATAARLLSGGAGQVIAYTSVPSRSGAHTVPANRFADEAPLAAATAALYPNLRHELIENPASSPIEYLDRTVHLFDRPPFNLSNHPWLADIRSAARNAGARVLLTGEIGNWTITSSPSTLLSEYVRQHRWSDWGREARAMLAQRRARLRGVLASSFSPWLPDPIRRGLSGLSSSSALQLALRPTWISQLQDERDRARLGGEGRKQGYRARTANGIAQLDYGQYRKGILAGWGIDKRDATADVRLVDFMMSLPLEMLLSNGERRPLARAALSDRLPAAVLDERRKGYQAPDWHVGLTRNLPDVLRLLDRIEADPRASDLIDAPLLRQWIRDRPSDGWSRPEIVARYRTSMFFALSAGHFVVSTSG